MGLGLISATGSGEGPRSRMIMPVTTGLRLVQFLGNTEARTRKNLAARSLAQATKVGTPVINSTSADLSVVNHYRFDDIDESANMTLFLAVRSLSSDMSTTATRPGWGGFIVSATTGAGWIMSAANTLKTRACVQSGDFSSASMVYTSAAELATARLIVLVVQDGVGTIGYDLTKGISMTTANTSPRVVTAGRKLALRGDSGVTGSGQYYSVVHHDVALTKPQIDAQAVAIRKFLSEVRGITV